MLHLPKPLLSANIYCDGHLDEVTHHLVAPFWAAAAESLPRSQSYLWFIRYARCGEHIKLRLHAPPEHAEMMRNLLEARARTFFERLAIAEPLDPNAERIHNPSLPPIDPEDAADTPYPDRTLLWTRYEPSPITVGSTVLTPDERYLALFTRSLAAGSDVVLAGLVPDARGEYSWRMRQNLLIKLVLALFGDLPLSAAELHAYFLYHRDWLVRYLLFRGRAESTAEDLVAKFDQRAREMTGVLATLREILESRASELAALEPQAAPAGAAPIDAPAGAAPVDSVPVDSVPAADDDAYTALGIRVRNLFRYIVRFRAADQPALDPYAPDQVFLPIFKCLHGLSNQIGLGMPKEAQIYHLLATAAAPAEAGAAANPAVTVDETAAAPEAAASASESAVTPA